MSYIWDIPDLATTEGLIQYWTKDPSMNNQKGHQQDANLQGCLWMKGNSTQYVTMIYSILWIF